MKTISKSPKNSKNNQDNDQVKQEVEQSKQEEENSQNNEKEINTKKEERSDEQKDRTSSFVKSFSLLLLRFAWSLNWDSKLRFDSFEDVAMCFEAWWHNWIINTICAFQVNPSLDHRDLQDFQETIVCINMADNF